MSGGRMQVLSCPLCRGDVLPGSSGCRTCSLTMADVTRHQRMATKRGPLSRAVGVRLTGVLFYGAAVAWAWFQLPDTLVFVVPAVAAGGFLHIVRGRPWVGLLVSVLMVVVLPLLLWPALGTGFWADLRLR